VAQALLEEAAQIDPNYQHMPIKHGADLDYYMNAFRGAGLE
jgi:hypothetical protein